MRREQAMEKLKQILMKRNSQLAAQFSEVDDVVRLDHESRLEIAEVLLDEFSDFGLEADSEPNSYGLEIEALIDLCELGRTN